MHWVCWVVNQDSETLQPNLVGSSLCRQIWGTWKDIVTRVPAAPQKFSHKKLQMGFVRLTVKPPTRPILDALWHSVHLTRTNLVFECLLSRKQVFEI